MADAKELALAEKKTGNGFFSNGDYEKAIEHFTKAIQYDPTGHVYYSNRSACYANLQQYDKALEDGIKCVEAKPDWAKGYTRKGLALLNLGRLEEAKQAYEEGLKVDGNNASLKEGLAAVMSEMENQSNPMAQLFGPQMWTRLAMSPQTRELMNKPSFVEKVKMLQSNPNAALQMMQQDPELQMALPVILGMPAGPQGPESQQGDAQPTPQYEPQPKPEPKPEPAKELTPEEQEALEKKQAEAKLKAEADVFKNEGNTEYKQRNFSKAIELYQKAFSVYQHPTYLTNEAAVLMAMKNFEGVIAKCDEALTLAQTVRVGYEFTSKAFLRKGNAYMKLQKYDEAIDCYNKSQLEERTDANQRALKRAMAIKKKLDAQAYINPQLSMEAKERGNKLFSEGKYPEAIEEYSEALKRDPSNYKVYSNRAFCYTKLMDWQRALADCDKCLEIDPTFVKIYIRKGKIQHFLKTYHKALVTFDAGLALDPNCSDLIEAKQATLNKINQENQEGKIDPERAARAMEDPEIQRIRNDPRINRVLGLMNSDPQEARKALADPEIADGINKLVQAGLIQVR